MKITPSSRILWGKCTYCAYFTNEENRTENRNMYKIIQVGESHNSSVARLSPNSDSDPCVMSLHIFTWP